MTPEQKRLARRALGLPNKRNTSYRNRYFTTDKNVTCGIWFGMVKSGYATVGKSGLNDLFRLTRKGAELALMPNEKLCPESFPKGGDA